MSLLGTTIGRIRLVDRLGKGGMGEVFVGYDETLDRKVTVKCVRVGGRRDDTVKGRFSAGGAQSLEVGTPQRDSAGHS